MFQLSHVTFATFSLQRSHTSKPSRGCQYFDVAAVRW